MAATTTTPRQLLLLADHLKLSLLERQRAISLNLEPTKQDAQIIRSLTQLSDGLEALEAHAGDHADDTTSSTELARIRKQYTDLYTQFHNAAPPSATVRKPNNPDLAGDFAAAQSKPMQSGAGARNVRFRDNPDEEDPEDAANRAALFSAPGGRYRDEPDTSAAAEPDAGTMDNQQIHAYHTQVLREQDEQLDVLGASIGRQRMLGIQMGNELDEQNELLDDVERGVDRHSTRLEQARSRLGHIARKSKANWSWVTIGILVIILILVIAILK